MTSLFVPTPTFPNVPALPGVPQMSRPNAGALTAVATGLIVSLIKAPAMPGVLFHATQQAPKWGVYDAEGVNLVINPDSIMDFGKRAEWNVSSYPVQGGQFANYNKVIVPFEIAIRMVKGSSRAANDSGADGTTLQQRTTFEAECEAVAASLDMFTIITPEKTYLQVNAVRLEFQRRETGGAFFIECEMTFKNIQTVTPQYTGPADAAANTFNAQNPAAVPPAPLGLVQPATVPPLLDKILDDLANGGPHFESTYFPNPLGGN